MASLLDERCDHLLLPRPWLQTNVPQTQQLERKQNSPLYVRGDVMVDGRTVRLPYWHKVARIANVES